MSLAQALSAERTRKFTDLYNTYYPVVYGAVYGKTGNVNETEDVCQDVFLVCYQKFDEIENPRAWLFGAIRITMFNYYRKKGRSESDIETLFEDVSLGFVNGHREARIVIEDAMRAIYSADDEKEKALFDLVAVHNIPLKRASRILGIPYGKARYRYENAVSRLIAHLNERGITSLEDLL